ncbi:hypothetical protein [Thermofilum sp.]|uniref:hypothetical protein n=1 Tax=Thermofilum sp. TaxID=1961369 RepID=UPI003160C392
MSETWYECGPEELKNLIKQDRFRLMLVATDDLAIYKYTNENKNELLHLGSFGFSFDPEGEKILFWVRDGDHYYFKEVSDKKFFSPYSHHELLGKRVDEKLGEVLKNGCN